MTFAEEMHELAEQNKYNMNNMKVLLTDGIRYEASRGNNHCWIYCCDDNKRDFAKRNRKAIIDWLKGEGFKVKMTRFAEKPEINVYW